MVLEKNPQTRHVARALLLAEDKLRGKPFPGMKRAKQIAVYACGPATLEMLLSFTGVKVSQTRLIQSIRAKKRIRRYGINVKDMAKATTIVGGEKCVFWQKKNASISDLDLAINKYKYPVGVEWQGVFYENEDEDSGHYGVITKIDKKGDFLRIADPYFNVYFSYNGTDRKLKISEFKKKWWDTNEVKVTGTSKRRTLKDNHLMFVITPKKETWPKKLGMSK